MSVNEPQESSLLMRALPWGVAAMCFALLLVAVASWGVDVPYWDQWVLVHHLESQQAGTLDIGELWRPHNEHRLIVPKVIMLGLASISQWDIRYELWMNVVLALALWLAYLSLVTRAVGSLPPWLVAVSSASIFGLAQWHNWSWGWQIQIFTNVLAVTLGFAFLAGQRRWALPVAALCGLIASYSFGPGLLFWPLALPIVAVKAKGRWPRITAWLVVSAAAVTLYLAGLPASPEMEQTLGPGASIKLFAGYVSVYLGGSLFPFEGRAALYGAPLMALPWLGLMLSGLRSRRDLERFLPLLLWASYGVGAAMLTALGRLPMGIGQALSSRYITLSQVFWLGLFAVVAALETGSKHSPRRLSLRRGLTVFVALLLLAGAAHGAREMERQSDERQKARREILRGDVSDESLLVLYPDPAEARRHLSRLEQLGLGLYRPNPESATP